MATLAAVFLNAADKTACATRGDAQVRERTESEMAREREKEIMCIGPRDAQRGGATPVWRNLYVCVCGYVCCVCVRVRRWPGLPVRGLRAKPATTK